ncbi:hypothetical protein [Pseudoxanthomonas wuyuanensis]
MPDSRSHFAIRYRLDGSERHFIWYTGEQDGVLLVVAGRLATFPDLPAVVQFLSLRGLVLEPEESDIYDFDQLSDWLAEPKAETLDCPTMLNIWNMLADVAHSLSLPMHGAREALDLYDKLFWGSNIPAVTPEGKKFIPDWSDSEIAALARVLSSGLANVREAARYAS